MTKLSETELALMCDKSFFIHKINITNKVILLLDDLNTDLKSIVANNISTIPEEVDSFQYKISRGENYEGYPWIILDYPRIFGKKNIFAFRTMYWWGNYFSFTFHVGGSYFEFYKPAIIKNLVALRRKNIYLSINENQWVHNLEDNNFVLLDTFMQQNERYQSILSERIFIKFSKKLPLNDYKKIKETTCQTLELFFSLLKS